MANNQSTPPSFVTSFIVENLPQNISIEDAYNSLGLHKFPGRKDDVKLSLAVDRTGHTLGHAFVQVPRSCTTRFLSLNGCCVKDQTVKVSLENEKSRLTKGKKWVKTYGDKGLVQSRSVMPKTILPYKPRELHAVNGDQTTDLEPLYDMCADLTHVQFKEDVDTVIAQSYQLGIDTIVIPGRCREQRKRALDLISQYNRTIRMYMCTGIGPAYAKTYNQEEAAQIEKECSFDRCVCIGPVGLDFRLKRVSREVQIKAFEEQVKLACEYSKPMYLIEHKAHEDFVMILTKYLDRLPKCAIVDFTGTFEELEIYIDMGFYISITGEINHERYLLTAVIVQALETDTIPVNKILLSSNAPRFPPDDVIAKVGFRPCISEISLNKICNVRKDRCRSEPLHIFGVLELISKYLHRTVDFQEFGKEMVKNSQDFLFSKCGRTKEADSSKLTSFNDVHESSEFTKFAVYAISVLLFAVVVLMLLEIENICVVAPLKDMFG